MLAVQAREQALQREADTLYQGMVSKFSDRCKEAEEVEAELENQWRSERSALERAEGKGGRDSAAAAVDVDKLAEANRAFAVLEAVVGRDGLNEVKRGASTKALDDWMRESRMTYVCDAAAVSSLAEKMVKELGEIFEGDSSAAHSEAEGEGLRLYENKEAEVRVTAFYPNGSRKTVGGDAISLVLGERTERGVELSEFERSVQANVVDEKNGSYRVRYRCMASGLEGKIPLHVRLNGRDVKNSPFQVLFGSPPGVLKLSGGANCRISSDGKRADSTGVGFWCEINPLPFDKKIDFRLHPRPDGWSAIYFFPKDSAVTGIGNGNSGRYSWYVWGGSFFDNGKQAFTSSKKNPRGKLTVQLTSGYDLSCYLEGELLHTFKGIEASQYKMVLCTCLNGTAVDLLS